MLEQQINNIREHYYQKRVQDAAYQKQITELCEREVVIHVDYSENFKNSKTKSMLDIIAKVNLVYSQ